MKKRIVLLTILLTLSTLMIVSIFTAKKPLYSGNINNYMTEEELQSEVLGSYKAYKTEHKNENIVLDEAVQINIFEGQSNQDLIEYNDYLVTIEDQEITWSFDVPKTGLYNLKLEYEQIIEIEELNIKGNVAHIERKIKINDKIPFNELEVVKFSRVWKDETEVKLDDQVRPSQVEKPRLVETYVQDIEKYIIEPYYFYFEEGLNTITFESLREPMLIKSLTLEGTEKVKSYEEVFKDYEKNNYKIVENGNIRVEGEQMYEKNSPTIVPLTDNSSFNSYPKYDGKTSVLNIMGVHSWRLPGYSVSYKVNTEEAGLYALNFRMQQDIKQGSFVSREILINGKTPFKEASYLPFKYNSSFNNYIIGEKNDPYLFYLEEGENIVEFNVSLGNVGNQLELAKEAMFNLNRLYLNIIMYTTVQPEVYRDYELEKNIPGLKETLVEEQQRLVTIINAYQNVSSNNGQITEITNLNMQLERFVKDPEKIVRELMSFESNISALGTWVLREQEQPLTLDYFQFFDPNNVKLDRGKDNFFESFWHETRKFFYSFFVSNDSYSGSGKGETIRVWVSGGRDNAQVLRRVIDDLFDEDINVNLELVSKDVLLRATLSGQGPDVALMVPEGTPIDFAFRNAAYDLSTFLDFKDIENRFYPSALTPFRYKDGVYALPEQQTFPLMFYRTNVFEDLELETPKTWEEVYEVLKALNTNNLDFYLESGATSLSSEVNMGATNTVNSGFFGSLLYQHGGSFYTEDKRNSALLSDESMQAFKMFTQFFTNYGVPEQANFVNRFRSGEIAAGIIDYSTYNTLVVFAPEIAGQWNIAPVPGLEEGNNLVTSTIPFSSMILSKTKNPDAAWKFLKWWTSTEAQVGYARELETIMGAAARYPTANKEALSRLSWPTKDLAVITSQIEKTVGVPQVPGGYMTTRQFTYALLAVINEGYNPVEALNEYIVEIDKELQLKRDEFNLD